MEEEMKNWKTTASRESIDRAIKALTENGIEAVYAENGTDAVKKVLSYIPEKSEVFTLTSVTLSTLGLTKEINESGRFASVYKELSALDPKTEGRRQRKLGTAPDFAVGSAHAVTETGTVIVASLTGSQLPAYAYGAGTLIWVVGAQKIVKDTEEGLKRIHEYVVGLESARARKAYGLPESFASYPSKILLFEKEVQPGRVKLVIVNEELGF
jgi:L-lactate utilization protein LutC